MQPGSVNMGQSGVKKYDEPDQKSATGNTLALKKAGQAAQDDFNAQLNFRSFFDCVITFPSFATITTGTGILPPSRALRCHIYHSRDFS